MNECMSPSHVCQRNFTCASAFLMRTYGRGEQTWSNCVLCEDAISEPPLLHILYICRGSACREFPCSTSQFDRKSPNISSSTASCHNALFGEIHYAIVCLCYPLWTYSSIVVDLVPTRHSLVILSAIRFSQVQLYSSVVHSVLQRLCFSFFLFY